MYFRAFTGAVSLKQSRSAVGAQDDDRLPRLHRRGLIEAIHPWHSAAWKPHFRAFTGAVSLKH